MDHRTTDPWAAGDASDAAVRTGSQRRPLTRRALLQASAATALTAPFFAGLAAPAGATSATTGAAPATAGVRPDEDGYRLWLRYDQVADHDRLREYRRMMSGIFTEENGQLLTSARSELATGLRGLLGRALPELGHPARGAVVLGTLESPAVRARLAGALPRDLGPEGYAIRATRSGLTIAGGGPAGALYGAFHLLRLIQTGRSLQRVDIREVPTNSTRMVDHWADLDRNVERGYAGLSIFHWDDLPELRERYTDYARTLASVGINASVVNSVNANSDFLSSARLPGLAALAGVLGAWGITFYLSANYAAPIQLTADDPDPITTADPFDDRVQAWWRDKAAEIYDLVPGFGGFLVKANSEGQPGPLNYGRTHAEGANMLADAVAPHGGVIFWRSFVHGGFDDWSEYQYRVFQPLDGKFADNVVVQTKNGPIDFQVREPVHPLFGAMPHTKQAVELQITQEYTGHEVHLCYLVPQWKEVLAFDTTGGSGPTVAQIVSGQAYGQRDVGLVGVLNFGSDRDWTGYQLGAANTHGFARLAWNPDLPAEEIATEWVQMTFGTDRHLVGVLTEMLLQSWRTYEDYTSPLGMGYLTFPTGSHFDPDPRSTQNQSHHTTTEGTGFDRTVATGTGYTGLYHERWAQVYESLETVPDELLLFLHWVPFEHRLHSGTTVIQHIYDSHFEGHDAVRGAAESWDDLADLVDSARHADIAATFADHVFHSRRWRDTIVSYFFDYARIVDEKREWLQYDHGSTPLVLGGWPNQLPVSATNATGRELQLTVGLHTPDEGWRAGTAELRLGPREDGDLHLPVWPPLAAELVTVPVTLTPELELLGTAGHPMLVAPAAQRCHLALDAGSASSPLTPGYARLAPDTTWDPARGFGWVDGQPQSRDRAGQWDTLRRDFCGTTSPATLRVRVPAGRHRFSLLVGDGGPDVWPTHVDVDGDRLIEGERFRGGTFRWNHGELDGGPHGRDLDLRFSSTPGRFWRLCALTIIDPDAEVPSVTITGVDAPGVLFGGRPNAISVSLATVTDEPAEATIEVRVDDDWSAEPVEVTLAAGQVQTVEVPVTPPLAPRLASPVVELVDLDDHRSLDVVAVPPAEKAVLALDAGSPSSPLLPGYARLSPDEAWDSGRGFGWVGAAPTFRDRARMDVLRRDFVLGREQEYVLRLAVPAGAHRVHVLTGDAYSPSGTTTVLEDGVELGSSGPEIIDQAHFRWFDFPLDGGESGRTADLSLVGSQRDGWWRVVALVMLAETE